MRLVRLILLGVLALYAVVLAFSLTASGTSSSTSYEYEYDKGQLTIIKHVVNDGGGSASASQFTLTINGVAADGGNSFPGSEAGTVKLVTPGSYDVTESGPSGYSASFSSGCSGTISAGDTVTCTVTNNDAASSFITKVTGSGTFNGGHGKVSFDLSAQNKGGVMSGSCTVTEPKTNTKIKCTSVTALVTTAPNAAQIKGRATINGAATRYTISVIDNGSSGVGTDYFSIDTQSGFHRAGYLTGGNISIKTS
jgi:prealbumin domain-containing protein